MTRPATDRPGTDRPGTDRPGTDRPGTDRPATDGPATDGPATDRPAMSRPGTDGPGTDGPGTDGPGTDGPGTDRPGTDRLATNLRSAADEPHDLDLDAVHARVDRRRRRRVRARAGACAVGALVVVAGLGLAAGAGDGGADVRAGEPDDPAVEEPATEPLPPSTEATNETTGDPDGPTPTGPAPSSETTTTTTTTAVPPPPPVPPVSPPPSTGDPAPATVAREWTYAGTEQYRLGQPQCPQITHRLDAEATASDGATWTLREDYCGEVRGSRWHGAGTWTLDAGDGTALSGTYTSSVEMDGPGEPYTMLVSGGTGALAGARGTCAVTVHLTPLAFGSQRQEGTISCDLEVADGGAAESSPPVPESA